MDDYRVPKIASVVFENLFFHDIQTDEASIFFYFLVDFLQ
jgi:hypothetical protein